MQKVNVKIKDAKNEVKYIDFVVASTKSKNNYYEDLENKDICVYSRTEKVQELYFDRAKATQFATELANTLDSSIAKELTSAIINALEVGCLVKRLEK